MKVNANYQWGICATRTDVPSSLFKYVCVRACVVSYLLKRRKAVGTCVQKERGQREIEIRTKQGRKQAREPGTDRFESERERKRERAQPGELRASHGGSGLCWFRCRLVSARWLGQM
jgi:hypothetical protein